MYEAKHEKTNTPARTSVTPVRSPASVAVGVEPTLTIGHGRLAPRARSALATTASRSAAANALIASMLPHWYDPPAWLVKPANAVPGPS